MSNLSIGQKVKKFRLRAGMSQLDLELSINSSPGSISRVEGDKVNPTKETILAVAEVLKLNYKETDYLIGPTSRPATEQEIQLALQETATYFQQNSMAYLIDERWRLFKVSNSFLKALNLNQEFVTRHRGVTTASLLTDPYFGILDRFSKKHLEEDLWNNLNYYYKEVGFMEGDPIHEQSIESIRKNPIASKIWDKIVETKGSGYSVQTGRVVHFNIIQEFEIPLLYYYEPLLTNARFQIAVWRPENKFLNLLTKLVY